MKNKLMLIGQR